MMVLCLCGQEVGDSSEVSDLSEIDDSSEVSDLSEIDDSSDKPLIEVRQERPSGKITGILPPARLIPGLSKRFFNAIKFLPKNFIKNSGIRYVTFLLKPKLKGIPVRGLASKGKQTIYLSTEFTAKNVYHELFHIFDPISENTEWRSLNAHNFVYTGSKFYSENLSKSRFKRAQTNLKRRTYNADFVSRYAMSNEREDRAETFAYMIVEGPNFLKRTRQSRVLKRKMDYIIKITTEKQLVTASFWKRRFRR